MEPGFGNDVNVRLSNDLQIALLNRSADRLDSVINFTMRSALNALETIIPIKIENRTIHSPSNKFGYNARNIIINIAKSAHCAQTLM